MSEGVKIKLSGLSGSSSPRASPGASSPRAKSPRAKSPRSKSPRAKSPRSARTSRNVIHNVVSVTFSNLEDQKEQVAHSIVMLHGRLNPELGRPADLYKDFLGEVIQLAPAKTSIYLPEYHEICNDLISKEPRHLELGALSKKILDSIETQTKGCETITLMGYSFGVYMLLKMLKTSLKEKIQNVVILAPVIQVWLAKEHPMAISDLKTLLIYGENDKLALKDSAGDPKSSVSVWLPKLTCEKIPDGNHLGYIAETEADALDANLPESITRQDFQKLVAQKIADFLGWSGKSANLELRVTEKGIGGPIDLLNVDEQLGRLDRPSIG